MLYDIGFLLFSLFYLPALIFKGKLHGGFGERFARYDSEKAAELAGGKNTIWIQAVSVGEVALCRNLIPELKKMFPESHIALSTITKAGNELAVKLFSHDATIIYFPLDFSSVVKKAAGIIKPGLYIMIETEIWPNVLAELEARGVPSILINGRISDRSYGKYLAVKVFLKKALGRISLFCMQSKVDAERIKSLGAPSVRVRVTGNMKFDAVDILDSPTAEEDLFIAGSTHPGEEEIVLRVFKELVKEFPNLKLLIAPRHIERSGEVEGLARKAGFEAIRASRLDPIPNAQYSIPIMILDSIGQLSGFYKRAKLVFVGGSLVCRGGQNPIEPASFGKAVIFGPHMFNFKAVTEAFLKNGAAACVNSEKDFLEKAKALLRSKEERESTGRRAKAVVSENRGATERNLSAVLEILEVRQ